LVDLIGSLGPWYGAGDGWVHQDPAQGQLGHRDVFGEKTSDRFDRFQPRLQIDPGKGFSSIELFAVAIELPVIVLAEDRVAMEFAGQQPGGEWDAGEDADLSLLG
jgi:hypothetical protein